VQGIWRASRHQRIEPGGAGAQHLRLPRQQWQGKSTTIRLIAALLRTDHGAISVLGNHVGVLKGGALRFEGPLAKLHAQSAGALLVDVCNAARAEQVLTAAGYRVEWNRPRPAGSSRVHGVELDFADKVNALLLAAGLGAVLFALTALVLGGRETET
jgi:hypothetical protein